MEGEAVGGRTGEWSGILMHCIKHRAKGKENRKRKNEPHKVEGQTETEEEIQTEGGEIQ